jgi:hypothetical protein
LIEEIRQLTEFIEESELTDSVKAGLLQGLALQVLGKPQSEYLKLIEDLAGDPE